MTDTLISLLSILIGIIGANLIGYIFKKYSLGIIGNTIAGVFGSIFFIKMFGRLGFDPMSIMKTGTVNTLLFGINILVSFIGGVIGSVAAKWLKNKLNQ
ncbi:hypothetical protein [Kaistella jeonii]|uniref:Uncharacterized protein n=1 Tax=Kaistella jeonii TaxID=266749 RepID=A0A0C1D9W6_9FLAO|nr:hypothetical protein [Kaistella jeonii]KIA90710.1 hypothetical protein OA86_02235 [Kaistella jeonii]SFB68788.1 hypothetical protein SAMN05421876_10169 [Kaistella jeonii]VEI94675.1 Uncharacterised protein [Kaistella jeonii]